MGPGGGAAPPVTPPVTPPVVPPIGFVGNSGMVVLKLEEERDEREEKPGVVTFLLLELLLLEVFPKHCI